MAEKPTYLLQTVDENRHVVGTPASASGARSYTIQVGRANATCYLLSPGSLLGQQRNNPDHRRYSSNPVTHLSAVI
ncbi:hypothetical protein [Cylindrospermum sp. FACHB-282]|uniref:hypothetical protein n=1 Tax=Cylindrospermum sp. FACHB-282 TaxID=2692794 RepID=UPI0016873ECF|nr:hypothetical protein [Cylindrospermum sp. FACHB-282]MBD2386519.1 hypothetical protein [Cylindrospermum sp. FACHB-282]